MPRNEKNNLQWKRRRLNGQKNKRVNRQTNKTSTIQPTYQTYLVQVKNTPNQSGRDRMNRSSCLYFHNGPLEVVANTIKILIYVLLDKGS